jgi:hypothetical protein
MTARLTEDPRDMGWSKIGKKNEASEVGAGKAHEFDNHRIAQEHGNECFVSIITKTGGSGLEESVGGDPLSGVEECTGSFVC